MTAQLMRIRIIPLLLYDHSRVHIAFLWHSHFSFSKTGLSLYWVIHFSKNQCVSSVILLMCQFRIVYLYSPRVCIIGYASLNTLCCVSASSCSAVILCSSSWVSWHILYVHVSMCGDCNEDSCYPQDNNIPQERLEEVAQLMCNSYLSVRQTFECIWFCQLGSYVGLISCSAIFLWWCFHHFLLIGLLMETFSHIVSTILIMHQCFKTGNVWSFVFRVALFLFFSLA